MYWFVKNSLDTVPVHSTQYTVHSTWKNKKNKNIFACTGCMYWLHVEMKFDEQVMTQRTSK